MTRNLFVYGTLMFPEIRRALAGREFSLVAAVLSGYRRCAVSLAGRVPVPAIVADSQSSVSGLVLRGVDRKSFFVFDTFEGVGGGLYVRRRVSVETAKGASLEAFTYVPGPEVRRMLEGPWDPETFRKRYLAAYRRRILAAWRQG